MGKLNIFEITLSRPNAVFHAGEALSGHLTVELNAEMKMRGIRLTFFGLARVHWTERHTTGSGKNRRTTTRHYSANEQYFNQTITVYGKAQGQSGDNPVLPAGRYTYPFSFTLPPSLPSSFEGAWGRVRYSVKGNIDRPWRFDHNTKQAFTVLSNLDLNTRPQVLNPFSGSNQKTLCCWCCKSGPISAMVKVDRTGYVPGESIRVSAEVTNLSSRTMNCTKVKLTQHVGYHATTKSRWQNTCVAEIVGESIPAGGSQVWNGEALHIPPVPPSELVGCRIIDIKYILTFIVDPSGPAFDLEVPCEITIGTIPLRAQFSPYGSFPPVGAPQGGAMPMPPAAASMPPSAPPYQPSAGYQPDLPAGVPPPDAPPPSYQECVFGKVDIHEDDDNEYTRGNMQWAPAYTYYQWNNPPK